MNVCREVRAKAPRKKSRIAMRAAWLARLLVAFFAPLLKVERASQLSVCAERRAQVICALKAPFAVRLYGNDEANAGGSLHGRKRISITSRGTTKKGPGLMLVPTGGKKKVGAARAKFLYCLPRDLRQDDGRGRAWGGTMRVSGKRRLRSVGL